jgi:soluble lytic murein transglycosylase-like protein
MKKRIFLLSVILMSHITAEVAEVDDTQVKTEVKLLLKKQKEQKELQEFKLQMKEFLKLNSVQKIYFERVELPDSFYRKLKEITIRLNEKGHSIKPEWIFYIMWSESRLKYNAKNPVSSAYGLGQFMPSTLRWLKVKNFYSMNATQQLEVMYKYYSKTNHRFTNLFDLYLYNAFPAALGKPDSFVFKGKGLSPSIISKQNSNWDRNKDGIVTLGEYKINYYNNF